jgi:hypothetical protein
MQHLCMDFKEFLKDKYSYNAILMIIDQLRKDLVIVPYYKTIDARGLVTLFIKWIYQFGYTLKTIISDRGLQFVSSF